MDLKKELRIIVEYILPTEDRDKDVIENYVDTLALINEEYTKQLILSGVSQQRELLIDFSKKIMFGEDWTPPLPYEQMVDDYLKGN